MQVVALLLKDIVLTPEGAGRVVIPRGHFVSFNIITQEGRLGDLNFELFPGEYELLYGQTGKQRH